MTRDAAIDEIRDLEKDLQAFRLARTLLYRRIEDLGDNPSRQAMLRDWPAFIVIDNGLVLAIVRCEGLLEDYRKLLEKTDVENNVVNFPRSEE